jgi:hypothetical protein
MIITVHTRFNSRTINVNRLIWKTPQGKQTGTGQDSLACVHNFRPTQIFLACVICVQGPKMKLGRSPARCASFPFGPFIQDGRLGVNTSGTKHHGLGRLPATQTLATSPLTPPHPSQSAGRNPMRAAPPRAPAPASRNYLLLEPPPRHSGGDPPRHAVASLPTSPPWPRLFHTTPRGGRRYRAGVELLPGGRVRLARGSFEKLHTGAWRSRCGGNGRRGGHHMCVWRPVAVRFWDLVIMAARSESNSPFRIQHNHLVMGFGHSGGSLSGFGHSVLDSPPSNFFF